MEDEHYFLLRIKRGIIMLVTLITSLRFTDHLPTVQDIPIITEGYEITYDQRLSVLGVQVILN